MISRNITKCKEIYHDSREGWDIERRVGEVKRACRLLFPTGSVVELRVLETDKGTVLGYYDDHDKLAADAALWSGRGVGVYVTIQEIDPRMLLAHSNTYKTYAKKGEGTQTANVRSIINLPIDFDHKKRPLGVSATDQEVQECLARADECRTYLRSLGWPEPIFACSGNGAHLVYRVALDLEDHKLFVKVYKHLQKRFEDDRIGIDQSVSDLAQIWKLYGTKTRKGTETEDCPHRYAQILEAPEALTVVGKELLVDLVVLVVEKPVGAFEQAAKAAGIKLNDETILNQDRAEEFQEFRGWRDSREELAWVGQFRGDLRTLDIFALWEDMGLSVNDDGVCQCPWHEDHTVETTGTKIWAAEEGESYPGFNCKHAHCSDRKLRDVLEKFGRDAVDARCSRTFSRSKASPVSHANGTEEPEPDDTSGGGARGKAGRPNVAALLVKIVEADAELLRASDGTPYARVAVGGHRETMAIDSEAFKQWLFGRYYMAHGKPPGSEAVREAIQVVKFYCSQRPRREVFLRWANLGDRIYLDLGSDRWDAVEITGEGWKVVNEPPVIFRRVANTAALPYPEAGGSLGALRPFFTGNDEDFILYLGSMLASVTRGPYFVTCFHGEQGSAKSYACKLPKRLLDPVGGVEINSRLPREVDKDLVNTVLHDHIVGFDNVSSITLEVSDFLCTLSTGGGVRVRELYTNEGQKVFDLKRPLYLNGIPDFNERPDLGDRSLTIHMPVLEKKRDEGELDREYYAARPAILGGFLEALVRGLAHYKGTPTPGSFRMTGAVRWVNACLGHEEFVRLYQDNRLGAAEHGLNCSVVAPILTQFLSAMKPMGAGGEWKGKASDLHQELLKYANITGHHLDKSFPSRASGLGGELMRILPALRSRGYQATRPIVKGTHLYHFKNQN